MFKQILAIAMTIATMALSGCSPSTSVPIDEQHNNKWDKIEQEARKKYEARIQREKEEKAKKEEEELKKIRARFDRAKKIDARRRTQRTQQKSPTQVHVSTHISNGYVIKTYRIEDSGYTTYKTITTDPTGKESVSIHRINKRQN
jgi:predicted phage gp36 major capsid-like protein